MKSFTGALALCLLTSHAFADIRPCEGAPGAFHTNPDSSIGGFVALNASVEAAATLSPESQVCDFSVLRGSVKLEDQASVLGRANISGNVLISGTAVVSGDANLVNIEVGSDMLITEDARIYGNAYLNGNVIVSGTSEVYGNARLLDYVQILGASKVCASSILSDDVTITDDTTYCPNKK